MKDATTVTPSPLERLSAAVGEWRGINRLHDPHSGSPEESESTAIVNSVLLGSFIRFDYTWSYNRAPQEGSFLFGYDSAANQVTAQWIDTWHMGEKVMSCRGDAGEQAEISVLGSYSAPPGPDWGWRTVVMADAGSLRIEMYNVTPGGEEAIAVEAEYSR